MVSSDNGLFRCPDNDFTCALRACARIHRIARELNALRAMPRACTRIMESLKLHFFTLIAPYLYCWPQNVPSAAGVARLRRPAASDAAVLGE